jgi:hypothetical protein
VILRVIYRRPSEAMKQVMLVESDFVCRNFEVVDGNLLLIDNNGMAFLAIPPTCWFLAEPATDTDPSAAAPRIVQP